MAINAQEILQTVHKNQKINYQQILIKMIETWQAEGIRPKLLIHSCCAPCSTTVLEFLAQYADITIYFANSNIHPEVEYLHRMQVQEKFVRDFNEDTGSNVQFMAAEYQPKDFFEKTKGYEDAPEGGERCHICYQMRLDLTALKAKELGFDYFASALTLSPMKNSQKINEIGLEIQELFDMQYLPSDFKKNNGYKRSIELCKIYDVYRQCYCGCVFASKAQNVDLSEIIKNAKIALEQNQEQQ